MKKLSFLALAAVGLLLGACSSDKDVAGNGNESRDGKGYLSVQINLPTDPASSTRTLNDNYDDGLATEYKVNNAILLLFHGSTEATATFWQAVNLTSSEVQDYDNDNITSSYMSVAEVEDTYTSDLWALVLINTQGVFDLGTKTFTGKNGTLGTDFALSVGTTKIADLQKVVFANSFNAAASGFFMTNTVLCAAEGGTSAVAPAAADLSILAKLADNCIKDTETEAKANPAGSVFVERAVAKATVSLGAGAAIGQTIGTTALEITAAEWGLNNTETSSYLVRNMFYDEGKAAGTVLDDYMGYSSEAFATPNYRFAGHVKIGATAIQPTVNFYRSYWCCDPQYSKDATLNITPSYGAMGLTNPQYCYENTFDVAHQNYKNTTRAVIKVTTDGGEFYTVNGAETVYTKDDAETYIWDVIIADANIIKAFQDNYTGGGTYTVTKNSFDLTVADLFQRDATTGQWKIDGTKLAPAATLLSTDFNLSQLATDLAAAGSDAAATANTYVTVLKYVGGVMYYEARFQHFADLAVAANDLAPWNTWEPAGHKPTVGGTGASYPDGVAKTAEENYLGRWGMVRNNWYDVQVTAFNKIGKPVDPSATITSDDTPDDNLNKKYISVKVNVLSWAKRTQSWTF